MKTIDWIPWLSTCPHGYYDQRLELEADAGEEDALLTETQLCEAADTETASLEANGRQLPVHTNLVLAVVNGIDFLCSV